MRERLGRLGWLVVLLLLLAGCGKAVAPDDAGDGDADADADGDSDADADADADGDADGDADADTDGDGDADPCAVVPCDDGRSCTADTCEVVKGAAECRHAAIEESCTVGSVCCVPSDLSCDPVDGTGCVCDADGVGCEQCGDFDQDGTVNYGDWEVTCTGAPLPTPITCCDFYEYDVDRDGDFDEADCELFWGRVLEGGPVC